MLSTRAVVSQNGCPSRLIYCFHSIVFVHGINGDRIGTCTRPSSRKVLRCPVQARCSRQTGTYKDRDFVENDRMWPKDFLPEKLPHARIVSFGYNADFAKFYPEDRENIAPELTIDDYSTSLLESVRALRKGEETVISPFLLFSFSPFLLFSFSPFLLLW